ncbi:MAG: hypothetical protein CBC12_12785 [Candidatus Puniceispirillum sp. TMED52]|nr:hypothetical protein [SAR116 cluster bacterium]OUU45189.1 MAG: hypothetical protein CBC12_12785 [Candidatus Puniceispirillum sp. TMED52]HCP17817.1 DUF2938 domain-containing protein [Alphaproteobacteria bacterium]|tara:strand:+ start:2092 stop:2568 length:477 start_codon:yes stop_codon:yes gene_type:complete
MPYVELVLIGIGSCVVFDLWQRLFQVFTSIPPTNWSLVGRWFIGVISKGRVFAEQLGEAPKAKYETAAGWLVHYAVAIFYAAVFALLIHLEYLRASYLDGFIFGVATVAVPWLFFMPAMGNGVFANKTPNPLLACALALMMHSIFGLSLGIGFSIRGV